MKYHSFISVAAIAVLSSAGFAFAETVDPGTYVTNPSLVSTAPIAATSSSTAPGDAVSLQIANDATNLYLYVTYNSTVDTGIYFFVDSDNNAATGYSFDGLGSNLGFEGSLAFTEQAGDFNSSLPITYGNGTGTVATTYSETTSGNTALISISLATSQVDATGYTGLAFPGTFTLAAYQDSGNIIGPPVEYTVAAPVALPKSASMGLLALGAAPLLRRRRLA